jgi:hypothetical protein
MIRVTQHTRRKGPIPCSKCGSDIMVGDVYREMIGMDTDVWDEPFVRVLAHDSCVERIPRWEVTSKEVLHRRAVASLGYVRHYYSMNVEPGQRCTAGGERGIITGGSGPHILVRLFGAHLPFPWIWRQA